MQRRAVRWSIESFLKYEKGWLPSSEGSYNVIVRGFLQHKNDIEAVQLIREMSDKGFVADGETGNLMLDLFVKVMWIFHGSNSCGQYQVAFFLCKFSSSCVKLWCFCYSFVRIQKSRFSVTVLLFLLCVACKFMVKSRDCKHPL